jgi:putative DNA methylase
LQGKAAVNVPLYGLNNFSDLFTLRQLTALVTFSDLVNDAIAQVQADALTAKLSTDDRGLDAGGNGARAYGEAVGIYLAFAVDKGTNIWSSICSWMNDRGAMRETFARQAIPMVWDYAEANPFSESG